MKSARVFLYDREVGVLEEIEKGIHYRFSYSENYHEEPISLTLPTEEKVYEFSGFPSFFEGLLPEGVQLEGLLRRTKIDRDDLFSQLLVVGEDLVGAVSVRERR